MLRTGARRARPSLAWAPRRHLSLRPMAATTQMPDGGPSTFRSYFVYGITAATTGLIAYSFYNSLQLSHGRPAGSRWYSSSSYDHADSPSGFTRKLFPNADSEKQDDEKKVEADKPQESSYLREWSAVGDRVKKFVVPEWAQDLPDYILKLQKDLSEEPGSLAEEIWNSAHDPSIHPEIQRDALVRVSNELCQDEQQFVDKRKRHVRAALAKYLDIPEKDIHPDDVPVIGMCGSGGGLRAMVAGASSYLSAQEAGLFDCITYTAGVSGSCWLQILYNSSLTHQNFDEMINHIKQRIGTHIAFPPPVLKLLTSSPTNKYLMAGGLEKWKGYKDADFGLVDVYGLLLGARLLVPKGSLNVNSQDIKLSHQRQYVDEGIHPLPLYAAVRHEIPPEQADKEDVTDMKEEAKKDAWFQWFEFSPYELFCEEFGAGIPTWAVGRRFDSGRSVYGENTGYLPELRLPLLMGIYGSAFCATLSHYYKEVRPLVAGLPGFGSLDSMIGGRDEDLVKLHPVTPAQIPNYAANMRDSLPQSCPESVHSSPTIQLMDAGMSNNLPIYPLLRPGRDVDVIVAFDASADIKQDNWLRAVDGYAKQRGIRGWPIGCGWPGDQDSSVEQTGKGMDEADAASAETANQKLKQAAQDQADEEKSKGAPQQQQDSRAANRAENTPAQPSGEQKQPPSQAATPLGYCTVWVGTTEQRESPDEPPPSKAVESDWELMQPDAGIAVVYFPFMANPAVEGVDPQTSDFMSTWNFIYTPEQVDKVVALAKANFAEGAERTRETVRAVYERKKSQRLKREEAEGKGNFWKIARQTLM